MGTAAVLVRDREAILALALREQRAGRHDEARAACARILAEDPDEPSALYVAALADIARGSRRDARNELTRLVALRPRVPEGHLALARLLSLAAEHGLALVHYERAAALRPDDPDLALAFVEGLLAAARPREAIVQSRAALARTPDAAPLFAALGTAEMAVGDAAAAVSAFRRALALQPEAATLRLGLARALLANARAREALHALAPLLQAARMPAPIAAEAAFLCGNAEKALLAYPAAIAAFERAIALAPGDARARLNLGNCFATCRRFAEAERALVAALEADPALVEAKESLGSVLLLAGKVRKAEAIAREVLARDPDRVVSNQNLAAICAASGRDEEAARHRNAAYQKQSVFVETAGEGKLAVLLPSAAEGGNVPAKFLFPRDRCTLIKWFIAYATPGRESTLPRYDIVFNGIGDADFAEETTAPFARFLGHCARPVLNPPASVAATRRDLLPRLLAGISDISAPPIARFALPAPAPGDLARQLDAGGIRFPMLFRPTGSHGGNSVRFILSMAALAKVRADARGAFYLSSFVPYRSADGYFRKYRVIFIDRAPYPYHLALSRNWLVHYVTADMLADPAKCREEARFLDDPEVAIGAKAMAAVRAIGERLDLDFAGMDFSLLPDGRLLVFEANAAMLVHPEDESGPFAYKNRAVHAVLAAFARMVEQRIGSPA